MNSREWMLQSSAALIGASTSAVAVHFVFYNRNRKKSIPKDPNANGDAVSERTTTIDPYNPPKRTGYLSWDDYFMAIAFLSAPRSKDPNRQVGGCLVSQNDVMLGKIKQTFQSINYFRYNGLDIMGSQEDALMTDSHGPRCKRFNRLSLDRSVLAHAGLNLFAIKAKNWSESAERFLRQCIDSGNVEACYFLGMIQLYCFHHRSDSVSLMAKAAFRFHAPATYSLAIIKFNGSGGVRKDHMEIRNGVTLFAHAAKLGHVYALRELGHCLLDGLGVVKNFPEGRHILKQAEAREANHYSRCQNIRRDDNHRDSLMRHWISKSASCKPILGGMVPIKTRGTGSGSQDVFEYGCGRAETRPCEFRRCSICMEVAYFCRGYQARHFKISHRLKCLLAAEQRLGIIVTGSDAMEPRLVWTYGNGIGIRSRRIL
ncbi:F-box protein-like protein [Drosera capensis]